MNKHDELRDYLTRESVPEQISPDNMQSMLEEKAPARKRSRTIHRTLRFTAGAAACAVLCTFGVHYAHESGIGFRETAPRSDSFTDEKGKPVSRPTSTLRAVRDYDELYNHLASIRDSGDFNFLFSDAEMVIPGAIGSAMDDAAVDVYAGAQIYNGSSTITTGVIEEEKSPSGNFSQTYSQEEGVLEADLVQTDGNLIYYLYTDYSKSSTHGRTFLNTAAVSDGRFLSSHRIDLSANLENFGHMQEMYLYNGMLIVIGSTSSYMTYPAGGDPAVSIGGYENTTYVHFFTAEEFPKHIGSYSQEGTYTDVRITPDGFLYLVTNDSSEMLYALDETAEPEQFVPTYGMDDCIELLPAEDILIPQTLPEDIAQLSYIVTGSLDLRTEGSFTHCDTKAVTGLAGNVYCSDSNLYVTWGWDNTQIHRIALEGGAITPMASAEVKGRVNDQFSMSEYNGYFRIAASTEDWTLPVTEDKDIRNNYLYVMDMELNMVGSIGDFGIGETIRSANFAGSTAYIVTYEQTDPLYSFDLSNPAAPVMLDEYKILGYSTYMQQWDEGLLLGFGANADEEGVEDGVKLVMFDNADPTNLDEVGIHILSGGESGYIWSEAMHERKALLIAPEKNLIGVPVSRDVYGEDYGPEGNTCQTSYQFFSYENGQFIHKGELTKNAGFFDYFNRAVYIGDYVYALSGSDFAAAAIDGITETDRAVFH